MSESFAELLEESLSKVEMRTGKVTKGLIVDMNDDVVIVNAGLKTEGEIPTFQFKDLDGEITVKIGDEVEVAIESLEDGTGSARLSREKAIRARAWDILEEGFEQNAIVTGRITGKVKGGLTVSLGSIRAFLPGSLVDVRPVKDTAYLEGKDLEFKVIKLDRQRNNVVVSRRAVVEKELSAERDQLMENMEEGQIIKGIVKNLTDYGAFVNLGGLDGLLHITDISWKRVKHPSEVLTVGDEIEARVLKFDKERNRVSLGLKQMEDDPWGDLPKRYPRDTRLMGTVTNVTDYGAFVEIEDGVEGLVHVSEMDWTNKNTHPSKVVQVGDEVEVMVLDIDPERRRISLGMKQCKTNPWEAFAATHNKNDKVSGMIKSITDFGVFVGLDGAIDGLIHLSDLSWDQAGEEAVSNFKKGDEVEAIILAIDAERERISLGLKQVDGDPFTSFVAEHGKGAKVSGTVESVDAKGVVIILAENVTGYLRVSEISVDRVEDARNEFNEGDTVESKITSIDRKTRRISLSIKAFVAEQESEVLREYTGNQMSSTSSLGDALKEQLSKK